MEISDEELVDASILKKLYIGARWGGCNLPSRLIIQGIPNHHHNLAKKRLGKLISQGLILSKQSQIGEKISLNPSKKVEIRKIIFKAFPELQSRLE